MGYRVWDEKLFKVKNNGFHILSWKEAAFILMTFPSTLYPETEGAQDIPACAPTCSSA